MVTDGIGMNWRRVSAMVMRYTFLYRRSLPRILEMVYWPAMDLLVWGYLTVYLLKAGRGLPGYVTFLIGAMIFWDILYRSQQGVTISFLEDIWTRNLLNIFVSPIRLQEFVAATFIVGLFKITVIVSFLTGVAYLLYHFNLFVCGLYLIPFVISLLLMGWALGLITTGLIMRWGQAAEALAWGIPFLIQPVAAVFYPLNVLPKPVQAIALCVPATHVFEGMRQVLRGEGLSSSHLLWAFTLNIIYLIGATLFFRYMYAVARRKGLLAKLGTQ